MKTIFQINIVFIVLSSLFFSCRKDGESFKLTEKYSERITQKEIFYGYKNLMLSIDIDDQNRVRIYDFSNIENPIIYYFQDIKEVFVGQIKNDRMFLIVNPATTTAEGLLRIYDVSNLAVPILLGEIEFGDRSFEHVEYYQGNLYLVGSTGVFYYPLDESELEAGQILTAEPQLLMSYELAFSPDVEQMFFSENKLVLVRRAGIWIADVSNPIAPDSLAMVSIREHFTTLAATLTNNTLCVLEDRDMFVYEFPSLELKGEIATETASTMVALNKNTLVMNGPAKLKFVDVSNPSKPKYQDESSTDGVGNYLQVIDESSFIERELKKLNTYLIE